MTDIKGVAEFYMKNEADGYEEIRLEKISPIEFKITKHFLKEYVKKSQSMKVMEVGVGYGHYSEFLVKEFGADVTLVDITPTFLKYASQRLKKEGLEKHIEDCVECSATELSEKVKKKNYFDVILFLGPIYHLTEKSERIGALKQAVDSLKPGGIIYVAAINILSAFRDIVMFAAEDEKFLKNQKGFEVMFETGIAKKELNLPIGTAYFHRSEQFLEECGELKNLQKVDYICCESFATEKQEKYWGKLTPENEEILFQFILKSCRSVDAFGKSDHFLYIGRKECV